VRDLLPPGWKRRSSPAEINSGTRDERSHVEQSDDPENDALGG
jgi:hypothetical protein